MRVLLDTCVVSEISRPEGLERVRARVNLFPPAGVFLSVVTIGEFARGVALLPPGRRRSGFAALLEQMERDYLDRILSIDVDTARLWGELDAARQRLGRPVTVSDGLIAATALRHGLHVVTRNVRDFVDTGVQIIDPWEE